MSPYKTVAGQNALTVLLSRDEDKTRLRMFFCPYSKNVTTQYRGHVRAIYPSYDIDETPQVMIRPQRMEYGKNIQYSFMFTNTVSDTVDFYLQNQYFDPELVKQYYCYNCQAPNLYFSDDKVVMFQTKNTIHAGDSYDCVNPFCKQKYTYLGMVHIEKISAIDTARDII